MKKGDPIMVSRRNRPSPHPKVYPPYPEDSSILSTSSSASMRNRASPRFKSGMAHSSSIVSENSASVAKSGKGEGLKILSHRGPEVQILSLASRASGLGVMTLPLQGRDRKFKSFLAHLGNWQNPTKEKGDLLSCLGQLEFGGVFPIVAQKTQHRVNQLKKGLAGAPVLCTGNRGRNSCNLKELILKHVTSIESHIARRKSITGKKFMSREQANGVFGLDGFDIDKTVAGEGPCIRLVSCKTPAKGV